MRLALRAEADTLRAKGDTLWAEAVIEAYGNVTIQWITSEKCIVNGTDTYGEYSYSPCAGA